MRDATVTPGRASPTRGRPSPPPDHPVSAPIRPLARKAPARRPTVAAPPFGDELVYGRPPHHDRFTADPLQVLGDDIIHGRDSHPDPLNDRS